MENQIQEIITILNCSIMIFNSLLLVLNNMYNIHFLYIEYVYYQLNLVLMPLHGSMLISNQEAYSLNLSFIFLEFLYCILIYLSK
jgi:hypothetical protein